MKRLSFGLIVSALLLDGCGGGSSSPMPIGSVTQGQHQQFAVPKALHQAVPPAPPNTIPKAPTAAQEAAMRAAVRNFIPRKMAGLRHALAASTLPNPIVRFDTSLGNIDVELSPSAAPNNVANFLSYVNNSAYNGSFMHRSVPNFAIQGGGYDFNNGSITAIPTQAAVNNEFNLSNVRGTLAMALSGPNTATSQWFFNEVDNSATLDTQSGGYTVIGNVVTNDGLGVMDAIAALQTANFSNGNSASPFQMVPVVDYTSGTAVQSNNLVTVTSIAAQPAHPPFFNAEVSAGNGTDYLAFSNGNYFGYYSYLSDENYFYHADLGFEYLFDANDGQDGVYLYDFASDTFFYTSPSFPFPYLYDFSLNSVVYYYPDPNEPGHYTTNPRYFYNFGTGQIITK